jgi:hypothetical protein
VARLAAAASDRLARVTVLAPEAVTLSSRSGVFPLTVANDLDEPVTVRVDLEPANPDRLSVADTGPLRVEPGEKAAVDIRADAVANGRVPVTVQLTTVDGDPLGEPRRVLVVATEYGAIGWGVVAAGMALLALATGVRVARRRRHPAQDEVRVEERV